MKIERHEPETGSQLVLVIEGRGQLALWWDGVPEWDGGKMGCIGAFESDAQATAGCLLAEACRVLADKGCEVVVGPMDGNTWRSHRLVTHRGERPAFFLEPWNPEAWPAWWTESGFEVLSRYSSSRFELGEARSGLERIEQRLRRSGVVMRRLRTDGFETELRRIYGVCVEAFSRNFLYTPLSEDEFVAMYWKVEKVMSADFAWIAEVDGSPCGFVFGLPDMLAVQRGEAADFIVKTLAVLPERRLAGLGSVLVERVQQSARAAGFTHAIHALQHESNSSLRITKRNGGELLRVYALYSKSLKR